MESKAIMKAINHDLSHTKINRSVNPTFIETNVIVTKKVVMRLIMQANFTSSYVGFGISSTLNLLLAKCKCKGIKCTCYLQVNV
jgi:hypothetical protein